MNFNLENIKFHFHKHDVNKLKVDLSLAGEDCQHAVTDESLYTVTGCALGTDVCLKQKLTWFKVKKMPLYN